MNSPGDPPAEKRSSHERFDRGVTGRAGSTRPGEGRVGDQRRDRAHPPRNSLRQPQAAVLPAADLRQWTPPRPVNIYVIEHAKALILSGTGQDRDSATDTCFPGGLTRYLNRRFAQFDKGANVHVPMMVQPPAGRCTWRVVRP
jgi:hypothetical protein